MKVSKLSTPTQEGITPTEHEAGGYERASTLTNPYGLPGPLRMKQLLCQCIHRHPSIPLPVESRGSVTNRHFAAFTTNALFFSFADFLRLRYRSLASTRYPRRVSRRRDQFWHRNGNVSPRRLCHHVDSRREHRSWYVHSSSNHEGMLTVLCRRYGCHDFYSGGAHFLNRQYDGQRRRQSRYHRRIPRRLALCHRFVEVVRRFDSVRKIAEIDSLCPRSQE